MTVTRRQALRAALSSPAAWLVAKYGRPDGEVVVETSWIDADYLFVPGDFRFAGRTLSEWTERCTVLGVDRV